jgi:FtsZ-binding cell division protein ZapB
MQTIEEYKEYTRQLEGEVKKWHDAFDASETMNRNLVAENRELKESNTRLAIKNKILQQSHDATTQQLQDLLDEFNKNIDETESTQEETPCTSK